MLHRRINTVIGLGTLAFAGCTQVGPDFRKPDADINPQWELYESQLISAATPQSTEWWQTFSDPVLNELINKAYAQNLSLEAPDCGYSKPARS